MKFEQTSKDINRDTITIKCIRLLEISNGLTHEAKGEIIVLGGVINFQMRAICMNVAEYSMNTNFKADMLVSMKLQGCSKKAITHTVIVKSSTLNLHRYFRVEDAVNDYDRPQKVWHTVYDNLVDYRTWTFDIEVTLLADTINEREVCRSALALLDDEGTADVELQGTDGTVRAHGCMLATASPFLRTAFYGNFKEGTEKKLNVPDADVAALKLLKQFTYTGHIEGETAAMATLYQLASRFMMPDLARASAAFLVNHLDGEGLKDLLQLDSKLNEPCLLNAMIPGSDLKDKLSKVGE